MWSHKPLLGLWGSNNATGYSSKSSGTESDNVSKCSDMRMLCKGIEEDLNKILELHRPKSTASNGNSNDIKQQQSNNGKESTATGNNDENGAGRPFLQELCESLAARLARVKFLLYEQTTEAESKVVENLTKCIIELYPLLMTNLLQYLPESFMPFESRKDIAAIFNNLMVRKFNNNDFAEYMLTHYEVTMTAIVKGHADEPDVALLCGSMLRSTLRHRALYKRLLDTEQDLTPTSAERYVYPLLDKYVNLPNFDVASDALATVREIFLTDRLIASEYLQRDYDNVLPRFNLMLRSSNYITRRLSLKLLGEILLDRSNFHVMMKYISSKDNLKVVMLLLSDPSPNIQFEAFHVFKVFVANPSKPPEIIKILTQNRVKLVAYLEKFHLDKEGGDDQFRDEKSLIISTLNGLE